ncbi:Hypothetical predicted protein [Cloeon dipterum]|uniref:Uncharacterized protein n=1 Tax=Cloeon dipterum TaxID=197152 RepID=A0A8S1CVP7_9INSE|nr:Hypothetical predicted protein [Cloeon dipterum]
MTRPDLPQHAPADLRRDSRPPDAPAAIQEPHRFIFGAPNCNFPISGWHVTPQAVSHHPPSFEAAFAGSDRRRFPGLCRAAPLLRLCLLVAPLLPCQSQYSQQLVSEVRDKFLFISRTQRRLPHPFCLLIAGRQIQSRPSYAELLIVKYPF